MIYILFPSLLITLYLP